MLIRRHVHHGSGMPAKRTCMYIYIHTYDLHTRYNLYQYKYINSNSMFKFKLIASVQLELPNSKVLNCNCWAQHFILAISRVSPTSSHKDCKDGVRVMSLGLRFTGCHLNQCPRMIPLVLTNCQVVTVWWGYCKNLHPTVASARFAARSAEAKSLAVMWILSSMHARAKRLKE